jgi:hypothetical protein
MALEGRREGKGEAARRVLHSCTAYVINQQGRFSVFANGNPLVKRDIVTLPLFFSI